jgi:hypothetical protein
VSQILIACQKIWHLFAIAYRMLGDAMDTEDMVQGGDMIPLMNLLSEVRGCAVYDPEAIFGQEKLP